jgi:CBS domain-containing protein
MLVREILRIKGSALFALSSEASLEHAVSLMAEQDIGSVVVMDHGKMCGMLTFREVFAALSQGAERYQALTVGQAMLADPAVAGPDTDIDELRKMMLERHQRYTPVMENGVLLGVLSFHDVAKAVLEAQSFENRMLKDYIRNWPGESESQSPEN